MKEDFRYDRLISKALAEKYESTSDKTDQDALEPNEIVPLYIFLASSLNIELVYIILTSLSEFYKLKKDENG